MNNKLVKKHQYALLLFATSLVFKAAMLPSLLMQEAGIDCYISVALICVFEAFEIFFVVQVSKNNGMETFKKNFGKIGYMLILVPMCVLSLLRSLSLIMGIEKYTTQFLLYKINQTPVIILLVIVILYVSSKGPKGIVRLCELAVWLIPIGILMGLFFGKVELNSELLLPVAGEGAGRIFLSVNKYLFFISDFTPLMLLTIKPDKKPYLLLAPVINTLVVVGIFVLFVMNYGNSGFLIQHAFAKLAQFNVMNSEIGSIDWPFISVWIILGITAICAKIFPIGELGNELGLKKTPTFIIAAGLILIAIFFWIKTLDNSMKMAVGNIKYLAIAVQFLLPVIVLCMNKYKEKAKGVPVEQKV